MAKTLITSIGIEYDAMSIRAAKLNLIRAGSRTTVKVVGLSELYGDFSNDDNISGGMKKIKEKIAIGQSDRVVTGLAGKQVYVAQIPFKKLPEEEMKTALRIEIKKSLPFEVAGASIDYQLLEGSKKDDLHQFIVTAVPSIMLTRHVNMMERLGIKPYIVDVLPLAIANAFHLSQPSCAVGLAYVVVHVGPISLPTKSLANGNNRCRTRNWRISSLSLPKRSDGQSLFMKKPFLSKNSPGYFYSGTILKTGP
jgi:Tfp pilus assembly PilM family ATPase